jgi:phage terminase small subunit
MKRKPLQKLNAKHEIFIKEMIEHGDQAKAYRMAYSTICNSTAISNGSHLANDPLIAKVIADTNQRIREETTTDRIKLLKEQMANIIGMREILTSIVTGEMKFEKPYEKDGELATKKVTAGPREVLGAVGLNFKILKEIPGGKVKSVINIGLKDPKTGIVEQFE